MGGSSQDVYHPLVSVIYFMTIILFTMLTNNPLFLGLSLIGSISYLRVIGMGNWRYFLSCFLIILLVTVTNPLFVEEGHHVLFSLYHHIFTLEAFIYGGVIGMMLVSMLIWFKGFNETIDGEKIIYLFGNLMPKTSLTLLIMLRFVPLFISQGKKAHLTHKTLGIYSSQHFLGKFKIGFAALRSVIAYSLESSVEMAQGMKARGYGMRRRSQFSIYSFHFRDTMVILMNLLFILCLGVAGMSHMLFLDFYPQVKGLVWSHQTILLYILVSFFIFLPTFIVIKEKLTWRL